jgi:DNA-binding transcriptional LysR family regulator
LALTGCACGASGFFGIDAVANEVAVPWANGWARTTRQLHVTEVGQRYYRRCRTMVIEAEHAQRVADAAHAAPSGIVRVCCPPLFGELILGPIAAEFMQAFPDVQLTLDTSGQTVDVIGEGYDVVFSVRMRIADSTLVVRSFGLDPQVLVGSPALLAQRRRPHAAAVGRVSNHGPAPGTRHRAQPLVFDRQRRQTAHHRPSPASGDR